MEPCNETKRKSGASGSKRKMLATATLLVFGSLLVFSAFLALSIMVSTADTAAPASGFNQAGNVLITDQFNNRVIEVNLVNKHIVWSFGSGNPNLCNPGPCAIIGSNDAERVGNGITLLSGTGIPAGVAGTTACVDNRVIAVNQAGQIIWQDGQAGKTVKLD